MNPPAPLTELFRVNSRFRRSVNVLADYHDPSALSGYIVTSLSRLVLRRVAEGLRPGAHPRSWSITGPYGAGKSACALFVARVLGHPADTAAREALRTVDPELYKELFEQIPGLAEGGFFVVLTLGSREPLPLAILEGLIGSFPPHIATVGGGFDLLTELKELRDRVAQGYAVGPSLLANLVERVARAVRDADGRALGLLFIVDELGKLLEYASLDPAHGDIFLLQVLSELADRSANPPIGLIVVLHQDFARYADRLGPLQRAEWRKVQGRFGDIAFRETQDELLRLIGAAIEPIGSPNGLTEVIAGVAAGAAELGIALGDLHRRPVVEELIRCAPLHPTVALVLGRLFRSRLAQNERSLFAFLTSGELHGLQDFLKGETCDGNFARCFYRIDRLYDYVATAMGSALYAQSQGKRWAEIDDALQRLPQDSPMLEARLIKAIGLFGLLGDQQYLKASPKILAYALADGDGVTAEAVDAALASLKKRGIAVFRSYKDAYALWEGSDIDLEECFQNALAKLDRSASLASLLKSRGYVGPYVVKRHLHETGTLRFFAPRVADLAELPEVANQPLGSADGAIVFVAADHGSQMADVIARVQEVAVQLPSPQRELLFFAVPGDLSGMWEVLEEVRAWEWVAQNTPGLEGDSAARKELSGRQLEAQARLSRLCAISFDKATSYSSCLWYWAGEARAFASAKDLSSALSGACDRAYSLAPIVHNELVNRRALSSAAAAARRTLIEGMLDNHARHRFGIDTGFPPEISMYLSVLERTRLHHREGEGWVLGPEPAHDRCRIAPLWDAMDGFLATTEIGKRPVSELFALLREPPFGVRDGLLPIFLAAALLHWEREVALFETGTFLPKVDMAAFERLMKAPEQFHLQRYRLHGTRLYMLEAYSRLLANGAPTGAAPTLLTAVRPLLAAARRLPPFSRTTKKVGPEAAAVREALFAAREPHQLLNARVVPVLRQRPILRVSGRRHG